MKREILLAQLQTLKPWLTAKGVARVRVFGSHARDEADPASDIDLLVELKRPMGLEFFEIQEELTRALGAPVDLLTEHDLHRVALRRALAEAIDA